jgi:hypothetical protein
MAAPGIFDAKRASAGNLGDLRCANAPRSLRAASQPKRLRELAEKDAARAWHERLGIAGEPCAGGAKAGNSSGRGKAELNARVKDRIVPAFVDSAVLWCAAFALACGNPEHREGSLPRGDAGESSSLAGRAAAAATAGDGSADAGADDGQGHRRGGRKRRVRRPGEPRIERQPPRQEGDLRVERWTVSPGNATGQEESDASLCFGLDDEAVFACDSVEGIETCMSGSSEYVVVWARDDATVAVVPSGTV